MEKINTKSPLNVIPKYNKNGCYITITINIYSYLSPKHKKLHSIRKVVSKLIAKAN